MINASDGVRQEGRRKSSSVVPEEGIQEDHVLEIGGKSPSKPFGMDLMFPKVFLTTESKDKQTHLWLHLRMLCLFACSAEAITTCFTPIWIHESTGINISATLLNFIGSFLEGAAQELQVGTSHAGWKRACHYFRSVFLGVFTSYCYMVDHAGDLLAKNFLFGPLYIISTLCYACVAFRLGQRCMFLFKKYVFAPDKHMPVDVVGWGLSVFVLIVLLTAIFGQPGFVRDPNDAQFLGPIPVNDGLELVMGMTMSCVASWLSSFVSDGYYDGMVDWGTWRCNLASCILTVLAYGIHYILPALAHNVAVKKFVSSFCGSLSAFSGSVAATMLLADAKNRPMAMANLALNIVTGLAFLPYLRA
ncbi:hypothetical protein LEN26_015472 [Aphanomyces euteiches]|uniref:Uncharacterized protein n=1 Tax=Aphanomyces euteiches TaxID=100861 RepID=A0A6G0XRL7_9STRA|nr:hypothetical protein Ae201684_002003 [Aphanomyces euteiches]KAH9087066.1 hypothetical protein Ae201684P_000479 [Aphanomyces euteiches]KAH9102759.1 hypothetical protein LEN26_015472 [Aphanomyces euteiches]KAH9112816.1 hypothetical protein AeMF1_012917 [Aphanomyces euteiches]KAH9143207.1 hypothetical protein AeRB84_012770 [Aphanomyces euteiches]